MLWLFINLFLSTEITLLIFSRFRVSEHALSDGHDTISNGVVKPLFMPFLQLRCYTNVDRLKVINGTWVKMVKIFHQLSIVFPFIILYSSVFQPFEVHSTLKDLKKLAALQHAKKWLSEVVRHWKRLIIQYLVAPLAPPHGTLVGNYCSIVSGSE